MMWLKTVAVSCLLALCLVEFGFIRAENNVEHIDDLNDAADTMVYSEADHPLTRERRATCAGYNYFCWKCYYYCNYYTCRYYCYWWCSDYSDCRIGRKKRDESDVLKRITRDEPGHVAPLPYSFEYFDENEDDCITIDEFCAMSPNIAGGCGENRGKGVEQAFEHGDTNGDGCIDRAEFANWPLVFAGGKPAGE